MPAQKFYKNFDKIREAVIEDDQDQDEEYIPEKKPKVKKESGKHPKSRAGTAKCK